VRGRYDLGEDELETVPTWPVLQNENGGTGKATGPQV
jgi:hypothetical protein